MSALAIGATDIPIRPDGHRKLFTPRGIATHSAGGYLRSNVTALLGRLTGWRFTTPPLTAAQATTVRAALASITAVTASGYLIGSSTEVLIRRPDEQPDESARFTTFTFELHRTSQ